ncbi:MAG: DNA mismatch repair protein MutS [Pyrinomonadaceae bacterium]|nr:DNA mismatch repair protein MutS [Pyrinomonadaceae bacterium]
MDNLTPLRKQYLTIKKRHTDALLLFRLGDFYEAFDGDAQVLARELDIALTSKPMGKGARVPLAGVPHHSLERHLATLISRGFRVAICEQLSDTPLQGEGSGRGLIERDVVRVVTPGTVLEPGLLQSKRNNYLAAFITDKGNAGFAYADVTTGEFAAAELKPSRALAELERLRPSEILVAESFDANAHLPNSFLTRLPDAEFEFERAKNTLLEHFGSSTLSAFGLRNKMLAATAAGCIISYLRRTQTSVAEGLTRLSSYDAESYMMLDAQTLRSLEIFESSSPASSLLAVLDHTRTPMGGRLLRKWLRQPLLDIAEIVRRQEHVARFVEYADEHEAMVALLDSIRDIERLFSRVHTALATANDLMALGSSLEPLIGLRRVLQRNTKLFGATLTALPPCDAAAQLINKAINDDRTASGGVIREGFSEELDRLRDILRDGKRFLSELETRERARTGIKSLRVGYNKVFGYYIEITRPNLHLVPQDYTRKQTLVNGERFVTLELKEHETLVVNSQERISELETSLFRHVCHEISKHRTEILGAAGTIAYLDVIAAFAETARSFSYVRPVVVNSNELQIKGNRHPVLERVMSDKGFVTNDVELGGRSAPQIALITGPNMSGKSTYIRQIAITILMAQTGCFVPASEATIGLCDRIFTRTGLYDRLGSGESTFMTEMVETAEILHHATPRSLILLDELGRGTSTYDGLSVARAVLEYIHNHPQLNSKTLFATHYHELTALEELLPRLKNFHVQIVEKGTELIFKYKVVPGSADRSYGVYAAKLAGLPRPVVRRAESLLSFYEKEANEKDVGQFAQQDSNRKSNTAIEAKLCEMLRGIDLDSLSPVEALMKLYEFRRLAEAENDARIARRA